MITPPKTIVFGAGGFLGWHFWQFYRLFYPDTIGTSYSVFPQLNSFSLLNPDITPLQLDNKEYSYGMITAGITNINKCELFPLETFQANVQGVLALAKQLHTKKITPIVFSSDYVFDGILGEYREEDDLNPLNEYGKQKSLLEKQIAEVCEGDFILLRLAKVFGLKKKDKTLIDEMAESLCNGKIVRAAYDQVFCPIYVEDVVKATYALQLKGARGIFNMCGSEKLSRLELATKIASQIPKALPLVLPISLDDLGEAFKRPKNTSMSNHKLLSTVSLSFKNIDASVSEILNLYQERSFV